MGNRITRAAMHLPADAVQERIRGEKRPWRRQRWEIIYQALTAPRHAEDIARTVGVSLSTVHRVIATYKRGGVAAIETPGKGGRRHQYLTLEQERAFLQPFLARAAHGEIATALEIQLALEALIGHEVNKSTLYRLLARHGLQQLGAASSLAQANAGGPAQSDTGPVRERREQQSSPRSVSREQSPRRYPSDLTNQEWAILESLIPAAKSGGRPRTVDMREVINAILYLDRTGCQWRALPRDFPPWPTVWTYFRTWRNDGTWERIHTALREAVRVKQGREPTPSAAIIDSQSVKTSQKGGGAATTGAKRSKAASGISSLTRMG
jgi:transposase